MSHLYKHNQEVYDKIKENFKISNICCLTQTMGAGKSFVAAEFVNNDYKGKRTLILAAADTTLHNYRTNLGVKDENVSMMTYIGLMKKSREEVVKLAKTTAFVVLDEYHRAGAELWGQNVALLMSELEKYNKKVLGITATDIRYLDNGRNMSKELFQGNKVEGINIIDGIARGILPKITYVVAAYDINEEIEQVKRTVETATMKITNKQKEEILKKVETLNIQMNNELSIKNIIKSETAELVGCQKWIAFCRTIKDMNNIDTYIKEWFGEEVKIKSINCGCSKKEVNDTMTAINEEKEGITVLKCVDMLNEGVHIKNLTGLIMMRKTESPNLFLQQLGRVFEAGKKDKPVVFDLMNNYNNLKSYLYTSLDILQDYSNQIKREVDEKGYRDIGEPIEVKSYVKNFIEVMQEVEKALDLTEWEPWEDEYLKINYPIKDKKCFEFLNHRSITACTKRVKELGLIKSKRMLWSEAQLAILKEFAGLEGRKVAKRFTDKSIEICEKKAKEMGWWVYRNCTAGQLKEIEIGIRKYGVLESYKQLNGQLNQISCLLHIEKRGIAEVDWSLVDEGVKKLAGIK